MVCGFSNYTEAFAVEDATAEIAAHVLVSICARYGVPSCVRSDRGSHCVNGVIEELMRIFGITQVLSPPYRPKANGMVERNGGELMRHLRALVTLPELRDLWSVVLPLATLILNKTYRDYLGCCPNDLVYVVPMAAERGFLDTFEPGCPSS